MMMFSLSREKEKESDKKYVEEVIARIETLKERARVYAEENKEFIGLFAHDPELQRMLPYIAFGQEKTAISYDEMKPTIDLTQGQHPYYAVSGASAPGGNCVHVLGEEGLKMGNVLVLRQPDSVVRYRDGGLSHSAGAFVALGRWKELPVVIHMKNSGNKHIEALYYYHKYGRMDVLEAAIGHDPKMKRFVNNKYVRDYIENGEDLYKEVMENGFKYYEDKLVVDDTDREFLDAAFADGEKEGAKETIDTRYIRALEVQQAMWDYETIVKSGYVSKNVAVLFQGRLTGHQFVWNPELERFIVVPDLDKDNERYEAERKRFLGRLPRREAWRSLGELLLQGARYYRRYLALEKALAEKGVDFVNPYVTSCSDSRSLPIFIINTGGEHVQVVFRNPGTFISRGGVMMGDAGRFFALAEFEDKSVIHAPHANCGAETAISAIADGRGDDIPEAFETLANHRKRLIKMVLNKGVEPPADATIETLRNKYSKEEVVNYYTRLTNIPLKTIADCFSVQQLLWDFQVARKEFGGVHLAVVFQNMTEAQNYVLNTKTMKFVSVIMPRRNDKAANSDRKVGKRLSSGCGCGCGGH